MLDRYSRCITLSARLLSSLSELQANPAARDQLVVSNPVLVPKLDRAGLRAEDYVELKKVTGLGLAGPELLTAIFSASGANQQHWKAAYRRLLIANRKLARQATAAQLRSTQVNFSRLVEALLWKGLETLREDAPARVTGRSRRNAKKAA